MIHDIQSTKGRRMPYFICQSAWVATLMMTVRAYYFHHLISVLCYFLVRFEQFCVIHQLCKQFCVIHQTWLRKKDYPEQLSKDQTAHTTQSASNNSASEKLWETFTPKTLKYWVGVQRSQSYLMGRRCLFSLAWPPF